MLRPCLACWCSGSCQRRLPKRTVVYPAGCRGDGRANFWSELCWLGSDGSRYERNANLVTGVQRHVRYIGFYPGPSNDGIFGSQTASAISSYQQSRGLGSDGVVGTSTWRILQTDRTSCSDSDPNYVYYKVGGSSCVLYAEYLYSSPRTIYVRGNANQAWRLFDVNGPWS